MTSPYLNTREAAEYLRFVKDERPDAKGLIAFIDKQNKGKPDHERVRTYKLGRMIRIHREDLDRLLIRRAS